MLVICWSSFGKVHHKRLLKKLRGYGINDKLLDWIQGFLMDRTQHVNIGGECLEDVALAVMTGVPQGGVLDPTLFIYFINDMPEILKCFIKIVADDTKVYIAMQSGEHRRFQKSIDQLVQWTKDCQIQR